MLSAQQQIKDIQLPQHKAILFTALSVLIVTIGSLFKVWPVLLFFALWLSHIFYKGKFVLALRPAIIPIALLIGLSLASTLWSFAPGNTLYNAIMFAVCTTCVVIMGVIVPAKEFVTGTAIALFIVLLMIFSGGNYMTVYATGEAALTAGFAGKNVVGHLASISGIASFSLMLWGKYKTKIKLAYFGLFIFSLLCLFLSKSATSIITITVTIGALIGLYILSKLPAGLRLLVLGLGAVMVGGAYMIMQGLEFDLIAAILEAFDKNPTLTGRTWLWSEGIERIKETFLHGYGYHGFWVPGQPHAEHYWDLAGFEKTKGFHFHNLYLETAVELGLFGLLIMSFLVISALIRSVYLILKYGMDVSRAFMFGIVLLHIIRSMAEVDLLGPFTFGAFLFYTVYIWMWRVPDASNDNPKEAV